MRLRYPLALPIVAICLALGVSPALAARPTLVPLPGIEFPQQGINGTSEVCNLGQDVAGSAYIWFYTSDDYYYTFFDPATCGCPGGLTDHVAHWFLFWPQQCQINVQAWIVKAIESPPGSGCYVPDNGGADPPDPAGSEILCGPSAIQTITGGGLVNHAITLPSCDCLANGQKAFVLFKIVNNVNCPETDGVLDSPALVVDGTPDNCVSYNSFFGGPAYDMVADFGVPGNTSMWVAPNCCEPTPTLPGSWGRMKTWYR
jgi:hypothetical protein